MKAVDLFAGAGGFTHGAKMVGVDVVWAANHWPRAVEVHATNHPDVDHACQDLRQFDFASLPAFDLLLASPACQGHSRAGQPARSRSETVAATHDALRSTAWAVIDALECCRPKLAIVENVPEFRKWELMPSWLDAMKRLGYEVTVQVLRASKRNVPQRRDRAIFVAHHEGSPIVLDDPDVDEPGLHDVFEPDAGKWVAIEDMRETKARKRAEPLAKDRARIANDRLRGAPGWGMHVSHAAAWGRPLDEPVNTITAKAGQIFWTHRGRYRQWSKRELCKAMGFPADYDFGGANKTETARMLGNAVPPPMAASVILEVLARA